MKVLFDVVHPADVHFFKHAIQALLVRGDTVALASRDKDVALQLLCELGIAHRCLTRKGAGALGLLLELFNRDYQLWALARHFQPDLFVSNNSPCASQMAWWMGKPSLVFEDTEINRFNHRLYYPFATEVHSPECYRLALGRKQRRYPGYHALAYLHPERFTPDPNRVRQWGLDPAEKRVLLRFVRHDALHDRGLAGLSPEQKRFLVQHIGRYAAVSISSEEDLPQDLEIYRLRIPASGLHDLLYSVHLVLGESATLCSEAVVLGTPAVYIAAKGRGYTDEQEARYGLCFNFKVQEFERMIEKATALIRLDNSRTHFAQGHAALLAATIDVAAYQLSQIDRLAASGRHMAQRFRIKRWQRKPQ